MTKSQTPGGAAAPLSRTPMQLISSYIQPFPPWKQNMTDILHTVYNSYHILLKIKYNLFYPEWGGGLYAPTRDFAQLEPKIHQKL